MNVPRSEESTRLIQCQICQDFYTLPKLLNCLHSFCEGCLQVTDQNKIICSICKQCTPVINGISGLKTNQFLVKLTGNAASLRKSVLTDQPIVCTSCDDEEASFRCNECDDFLCDGCREAHSRVRVTRNHKILSICDIRNGQYDVELVTRMGSEECPRHDGESLRFFCKTCDYLICRDCLLCDNHLKGNHECVCVKEVVNSSKEEVNSALEEVQQKKKELVIASEAVESLLDDIERMVCEAESRVNMDAVQSIRNMEDDRERLLRQIRSKKSDHVRDLFTVLEQIDNGLRSVTDLTTLANNLIVLGQATDILFFKNSIITCANKLSSSISVPTVPSNLDDVAFPFEIYEPGMKVDKATQMLQEVRIATEKISIGTSTREMDDMNTSKTNEEKDITDKLTGDQNIDKGRKLKEEFIIIEDNMSTTVRQSVVDIVNRAFGEHDERSDEVLSSVKDSLELKFGPTWHVVAGTFSWNMVRLNLSYAILKADDQNIIIFCSGSAQVSKQTLHRKVIVVETDMIDTMKRDMLRFSKQAMSRYTNRSDIAKNIVDVFSRKHGGKWQCFIMGEGSMFGLTKLPTAKNSCIHITIGTEILVLLKLSSR
ncbi:E3 ubiquitin-protein ligase TRIM56-like [Anneissia japonica]|uniref:E3 ubiquitin-protein ligase TRIM56-like n=1 Tax=Anneissia japonica TaxID=1529436 RepID=UPI0014258402|nr:E3 ubiquitin-protein ligase TRIM56-like [Anneissia japonica]